jgi:hypothetical protein
MTTLRPSKHAHHSALAAALSGRLSPALALMAQAPDTLLARAEDEGVRPLLVEHLLRETPRALDDGQYAALADRAAREAARAVHTQVELRDCLADLVRAGVPCVVFKGAATAYTLFPRPELRPMDDADLLLDARHRQAAVATLETRGYDAVPGNTAVLHQVLLRKPAVGGGFHNLDLHWRLTSRAHPRPRDPMHARALLLRAVQLPALGPTALQPDPLDRLLIAAQHLWAHHAGALRLIWLYEIHLMVLALDAAQRGELRERARRFGHAGMLASALAASAAVFSTPVGDLLDAPASDLSRRQPRAVRWLAELRELPGSRARLAWLWQHALPPADFMRERAGADRAPLPLQYLRRAVGGLRRSLHF